MDFQRYEILLWNWIDCLVRVNSMQPQTDVLFLAIHVTAAVLSGWGLLSLARRHFR